MQNLSPPSVFTLHNTILLLSCTFPLPATSTVFIYWSGRISELNIYFKKSRLCSFSKSLDLYLVIDNLPQKEIFTELTIQRAYVEVKIGRQQELCGGWIGTEEQNLSFSSAILQLWDLGKPFNPSKHLFTYLHTEGCWKIKDKIW